jgi:hypothetical protein
MSTKLSITISTDNGDVLPLEIESNEPIENVKALVEVAVSNPCVRESLIESFVDWHFIEGSSCIVQWQRAHESKHIESMWRQTR